MALVAKFTRRMRPKLAFFSITVLLILACYAVAVSVQVRARRLTMERAHDTRLSHVCSLYGLSTNSPGPQRGAGDRGCRGDCANNTDAARDVPGSDGAGEEVGQAPGLACFRDWERTDDSLPV
jgi:hypothetical protein